MLGGPNGRYDPPCNFVGEDWSATRLSLTILLLARLLESYCYFPSLCIKERLIVGMGYHQSNSYENSARKERNNKYPFSTHLGFPSGCADCWQAREKIGNWEDKIFCLGDKIFFPNFDKKKILFCPKHPGWVQANFSKFSRPWPPFQSLSQSNASNGVEGRSCSIPQLEINYTETNGGKSGKSSPSSFDQHR